mmetsp:Transcript_46672/g.129879  ORF Transcript_46672/g.129879 Transcript_46672/m.129879 type:complete len:202 (-) Transcript_46672:806-1411(-)
MPPDGGDEASAQKLPDFILSVYSTNRDSRRFRRPSTASIRPRSSLSPPTAPSFRGAAPRSWMYLRIRFNSARSKHSCLAEAGPCTYLSPRRNSSQLTRPLKFRSRDLKMSASSSWPQAVDAWWRWMCSATSCFWRSSANSARVRPASSPVPCPLKNPSSVATYLANSRSSSCFSPRELTLLMHSVITPVRRAIIAKAVIRM